MKIGLVGAGCPQESNPPVDILRLPFGNPNISQNRRFWT